MRSPIAAGVGLFLGIIALKNADDRGRHPATSGHAGQLREPGPILAMLGFF